MILKKRNTYELTSIELEAVEFFSRLFDSYINYCSVGAFDRAYGVKCSIIQTANFLTMYLKIDELDWVYEFNFDHYLENAKKKINKKGGAK